MTKTPPHTRLILASEDLLEQFGARTESGLRITAGWGEQRPEGWYEPIFRTTEDEGAQDMRDGAALRRLREALPDVPSYPDNYVVRVYDDPHDARDVRVVRVAIYDAMDREICEGFGFTIAEAADKCRAALK